MKECEDIKNLLEEYLDKELSPRENTRVKRHLLRCPFCRRDLEDLRRLRETLNSLPQDKAPDDFLDRLHRRMDRQRQLDSVLRRIMRSPAVKVPAALVLGLICVVTVFRSLDVHAPLEKMSRPKLEMSYKMSVPEDTAASRKKAVAVTNVAATGSITPEKTILPDTAGSGEAGSGRSEQDIMSFEKKEEPAVPVLAQRNTAAEIKEREPVQLSAAAPRMGPEAGEKKEAPVQEMKEAEEIPEAPLLYSRQRVEISVNDLGQGIVYTLDLIETLGIAILVPTDKELRRLDTGTYTFVEFVVRAEGYKMKSFFDKIESAGIGKIVHEEPGDIDRYQTVVLQVHLTTVPSP